MAEHGYDRLKVFSGSANPALAQEMAEHLGVPVGEALVDRFSDGEVRVVINESVRGADVFVIQPTCPPVNETVMELLIMIDALRRASARRIVTVIPYFGYARQDRKTRAREPITAKLVANLIVAAGASRVLAMDLHAGQIQGFFDVPLDHLSAVPILGDYFASKGLKDLVVVSPDLGGVTRARDLAHRLGAPIAMVEKRRPEPSVAEVMNVIGEVEGRAVIMVDDMIDTAGSVILAADAFAKQGAREIYACCTHLVLSGMAKERIESSSLQEVVATNTIPLSRDPRSGRFKILSVAGLLAEAIGRIHLDQSVSALFE